MSQESGRNCNKIVQIRGQQLNKNLFLSSFSGTAGISQQNPGISRPKSLTSLVSRDIPNFLAPTPSRGRPLPQRKVSGLKSLGLCSFFEKENQRTMTICIPSPFQGNLGHGHRSSPPQKQIFRGPWPYVSHVFWEDILVMVIVFFFPIFRAWHMNSFSRYFGWIFWGVFFPPPILSERIKHARIWGPPFGVTFRPLDLGSHSGACMVYMHGHAESRFNLRPKSLLEFFALVDLPRSWNPAIWPDTSMRAKSWKSSCTLAPPTAPLLNSSATFLVGESSSYWMSHRSSKNSHRETDGFQYPKKKDRGQRRHKDTKWGNLDLVHVRLSLILGFPLRKELLAFSHVWSSSTLVPKTLRNPWKGLFSGGVPMTSDPNYFCKSIVLQTGGVCHLNGWCIDYFQPRRGHNVDTEMEVKLIPRKYVSLLRFRIDINWTDYLLHWCPHRYFTPNFTFAFTFVILKVINSEIILFRFALISMSMVLCNSIAIEMGGV